MVKSQKKKKTQGLMSKVDVITSTDSILLFTIHFPQLKVIIFEELWSIWKFKRGDGRL
jgi:hypothetical protein